MKEPAATYDLAADTESGAKAAVSVRTTKDKDVGTLTFDFSAGALVLQVTGDLPLKRVQEVEIQTRDGKILSGEVSFEGNNRLVLLRQKKDISQRHIANHTVDSGIDCWPLVKSNFWAN